LLFHIQSLIKSLPPLSSLRNAPAEALSYHFGERLYVHDTNDMMREVQVIDSQKFKVGAPFESHGHH
jgi:hypothetical protein